MFFGDDWQARRRHIMRFHWPPHLSHPLRLILLLKRKGELYRTKERVPVEISRIFPGSLELRLPDGRLIHRDFRMLRV